MGSSTLLCDTGWLFFSVTSQEPMSATGAKSICDETNIAWTYFKGYIGFRCKFIALGWTKDSMQYRNAS